MNKIKIGFVGVGSMGQCAHLKNYAALPDCEVVALSELRPGLGAAVARRYNVPRVYATGEAMLAAEELDGIVAAQYFERHGSIIPPLYTKGVPVFTEKPLAGSIQVGARILEALKAGGSWHMVGYHKRSDPATMAAKAAIDGFKASGEIGKLRYVRLLMPAGDWIASGFTDLIHSDEPMPDLPLDPPAEDMDPDTNKAYISFVNYYIHQVNLMRHLLGEPYQVSYADPSGALLAVSSASGIAGTIEMSPYQTTIDWQESALIAFERGWIKLELPAPLASNRPGRVEIFTDAGSGATPQTVMPQLPWVHAMRRQAENFVRAIRGEIRPMCDAAEALEDLQVARQYMRLMRE